MASTNPPPVDFSATLLQAPMGELWVHELLSTDSCSDIAQATFDALQNPLDFPPLHQAIVPGDRVALAIDANIPSLDQVISGALRAVERCGAEGIEIVLSDEATDETLASIAAMFGSKAHVTRHQSSQRESLRYVAADDKADPIYLNRWLVDADFVLPITVERRDRVLGSLDALGVYPVFADSATRRRARLSDVSVADPSKRPMSHRESISSPYDEPAWWLGVQLIVNVAANQFGHAVKVVSGTSHVLHADRTSLQDATEETLDRTSPPSAAMVIASLDGTSQQQTWINAARGVVAATRFVLPGGTIVLWSEIDHFPRIASANSLDDGTTDEEFAKDSSQDSSTDAEELSDVFPPWQADVEAIETLVRIGEEFRIMIHSRLDAEAIESLGFGAIPTAEHLQNLRHSFASCGLLRAAQFIGGGSE
jgi:hypothetical protein